jgi:hypothetical protein
MGVDGFKTTVQRAGQNDFRSSSCPAATPVLEWDVDRP